MAFFFSQWNIFWIIFTCDKRHIKCTTLNIFKCTVAFSTFPLHNCHHHPSPELFASCKTETLCPISSSLGLWAALYFLSLGVWLLQRPPGSAVLQCLPFDDWLISLSLLSSTLIHVVTCVILASIVKLSNIPLNVYRPHFAYPFICQCTDGLLPPLGYCG